MITLIIDSCCDFSSDLTWPPVVALTHEFFVHPLQQTGQIWKRSTTNAWELLHASNFLEGISAWVMELSWIEWKHVWKSQLHLGNGGNACDGMMHRQNVEVESCVTSSPTTDQVQSWLTTFKESHEIKVVFLLTSSEYHKNLILNWCAFMNDPGWPLNKVTDISSLQYDKECLNCCIHRGFMIIVAFGLCF